MSIGRVAVPVPAGARTLADRGRECRPKGLARVMTLIPRAVTAVLSANRLPDCLEGMAIPWLAQFRARGQGINMASDLGFCVRHQGLDPEPAD
jgi:hypothetical protein